MDFALPAKVDFIGGGLRAINENISPPIVIYLTLVLNILNVGLSF